jgi:hypothetical protein
MSIENKKFSYALLPMERSSNMARTISYAVNIETVNSMVKCRFGATLRKRLDPRKETESKLKLVAHDIRRIGYIEALDDITPHWPRKGV